MFVRWEYPRHSWDTGVKLGTNLLEIKVTENKTFQSEIATNNYRPLSIASWQRRAQISEANVTE